MNRAELVCPRCGASRESGTYCPYCGYGLRDDPVYLLGGPVADGVAATVAALIPACVALASGGAIPWVLFLAIVLLVMALLAFFTFLRPFTTLRRAFAVSCGVYSLPATIFLGCAGLTAVATGDGAFGLLVLLILVGVLLLHGTVWFFAYRRP